MCMNEPKNLRYCFEVLRRRILGGDEQSPYWRMKLRVAEYFLKRYDAAFDPDSWHYVRELSDTEESELLKEHPLLQVSRAYGEYIRRPSRKFELELRKKIEKYLEIKAKHAAAAGRPASRQ